MSSWPGKIRRSLRWTSQQLMASSMAIALGVTHMGIWQRIAAKSSSTCGIRSRLDSHPRGRHRRRALEPGHLRMARAKEKVRRVRMVRVGASSRQEKVKERKAKTVKEKVKEKRARRA